MEVEPGLVKSIGALQAEAERLATPTALMVITPGQDVARRWQPASMSARRQVARLLLTPAVLGQLRVTRAPTPGHRGDAADRVRWENGHSHLWPQPPLSQ